MLHRIVQPRLMNPGFEEVGAPYLRGTADQNVLVVGGYPKEVSENEVHRKMQYEYLVILD